MVRSNDLVDLLDIPVGLEPHRVHRYAAQKREEGVRAEGETSTGVLDVAVAAADNGGDWVTDLMVM